MLVCDASTMFSIFCRKVTRDLQPHQDITYVRCLLIFKLWKRFVARGKERNSLNRLAVARLSPPPPQLLEMVERGLMVKVLPLLPPNKKPALVTRFYMLAKFNLRESIKVIVCVVPISLLKIGQYQCPSIIIVLWKAVSRDQFVTILDFSCVFVQFQLWEQTY